MYYFVFEILGYIFIINELDFEWFEFLTKDILLSLN